MYRQVFKATSSARAGGAMIRCKWPWTHIQHTREPGAAVAARHERRHLGRRRHPYQSCQAGKNGHGYRPKTRPLVPQSRGQALSKAGALLLVRQITGITRRHRLLQAMRSDHVHRQVIYTFETGQPVALDKAGASQYLGLHKQSQSRKSFPKSPSGTAPMGIKQSVRVLSSACRQVVGVRDPPQTLLPPLARRDVCSPTA